MNNKAKCLNDFTDIMSQGSNLSGKKQYEKANELYYSYLGRCEKIIIAEKKPIMLGYLYQYIFRNYQALGMQRKIKETSEKAIKYFDEAYTVFKKSRRKDRYYSIIMAQLLVYYTYKNLSDLTGIKEYEIKINKSIENHLVKMKNKKKDYSMINIYIGICNSIGDEKIAKELKLLVGNHYEHIII